MAQHMPTGAPRGGAAAAFALPGFDASAFDSSASGRNASAMQAIHRRHPDDEMHPEVVEHWLALGVQKQLFGVGSDGKYSVLTPLDLDPTRRYPLVYVSHGGLEPIDRTETNGFGALAGRHGFIAVFPWNGGPSNDRVESEFPRILGELLDRGYPIDRSRVYAVGYSAGSDATGVLACAYPELLAAVSPSPGGNLFAKGRWYAEPASTVRNRDVRLPMISVAGTMDGGDRYPLQRPEHLLNLDIWLRDIVHVPGYRALAPARSAELASSSDDPARRAFGFDFDRTFAAELEERTWLFGDYLDGGVAVARFVAGVGLPHVQTAVHAPLIWDFLRHFSRDLATGASVHAPVVLDELALSPAWLPEVVPAGS